MPHHPGTRPSYYRARPGGMSDRTRDWLTLAGGVVLALVCAAVLYPGSVMYLALAVLDVVDWISR